MVQQGPPEATFSKIGEESKFKSNFKETLKM